MLKCVLFVDDEPNVLEGLRSRLWRQRRAWKMSFVTGGAEALELMGREHVDVVVSDLRMPRMDGATLLQRIQERYPSVVRIVLSGHAELALALRTVPVAHQFLAKPCDPGVLEDVVDRACGLQVLLSQESVLRVVGGVNKLPSLPRVHAQLAAALLDPDVTVGEIAAILRQDTAMSAKTLQIVNSAFFRLSRKISSLEDAVSYLGFNTIKQVAMAVEVFRVARAGSNAAAVAALQAHAVRVGSLAAELVEDKRTKEEAFVAGLLHDIGRLLLVSELPSLAEAALDKARLDGCPLHEAEQSLWGVTHAEIGAYLLGIWGLPYPIIEATANHHAPSRVGSRTLGILAATHAADALVRETEPPEQRGGLACPPLDLRFLEDIGCRDSLENWRALAQGRALERLLGE